MAELEETPETPPTQPAFDETKMAELIKNNVSTSLKELIAEQQANQPPPPVYAPQQQIEEPDFWDQQINPRINARVGHVNLRAEAAEDKVDFYQSEAWETELNEMLPGDSDEEIAKHKKEIRSRLEKTFLNLLQTNRGTKRADILDYEVGKYLREKKTEFKESIVKKDTKKRDTELNKARRGVDISSGSPLSNFTVQDIYSMDEEKMLKEFGHVGF